MHWVQCLYEAHRQGRGGAWTAAQIYGIRHPRSLLGDVVQKAATLAGSTALTGWAAELAAAQPFNDLLAFMRPASIVGNLPDLRRVPLNVSLPSQTGGGTYGWVGQGAPSAATKLAFTTLTLTPAKVGGIVAVTKDLVQVGGPPDTATALRDDLTKGTATFLDTQFCDPAVAGVADVSPASITNGVTPLTPSGTTAAALELDVDKLLGQFFTANNGTTAALLLPPAYAVMLARQSRSDTLGAHGGAYLGIPAVTSSATGGRIIVVEQDAILFSDRGVEIDVSEEATPQLDSAPTNPADAAVVPTSFWQLNLVGLRVLRFISWQRSRTTAVSLLSPCAYVAGT
jgi:hypothetical protein